MSGPDRFREPLYSVRDAATFLGVPESTLGAWVRGTDRARPIVSATQAARGPRIPFIGLAEGLVGAAFRQAGVSMQHIRKALSVLDDQLGIEHALASQRLYTDGASILFDYADRHRDEMDELTVVVSQQRVFTDIVREYLSRIDYLPDGWAGALVLPITKDRAVKVDPERAFGQPIFMASGARLEDVRDRWLAGEPLADVCRDFDVPERQVEDVLRAIVRTAA
jgi:uncharacterized protein (DUF433 family)